MAFTTAHRFFGVVYTVLLVLYLGFVGLDRFERLSAWGWTGVNYTAIIQIALVSIAFSFFLRKKLRAPETTKSSKAILILIFVALMVGLLLLTRISLVSLFVSGGIVFSLYLHRKLATAESSRSSSVYLALTSLSFFFFVFFVLLSPEFFSLGDELGLIGPLFGRAMLISWVCTLLCGIFVLFKNYARKGMKNVVNL